MRIAKICSCGEHGFVGLTQGKVSLYSPDDHDLVAGRFWHAVNKPRHSYAVSGRDYMHRIIAPNLPMVDHKNLDGLDNRRSNLRKTTPSKNAANCRSKTKSNHKLKGIRKVGQRYYARLRVNGKRINSHGHTSAIEAARTYDQLATLHFGEHAGTNKKLGTFNTGRQSAARSREPHIKAIP